MKKRTPAEWETLKENILNYPEHLPIFEDDGGFLSIARTHSRMLALEQSPAERKEILSDLTRLAKIPPHLEDRFKLEVSNALHKARLRWIQHGGILQERGKKNALRKAEQKVREALIAVRALHPVEQEAIFNAFLPRSFLDDVKDSQDDSLRLNKDWRRVGDLLSAVLAALAEVSGRSPHRERAGKRGRPKGDAGDWPFQSLVRALRIAADRCHGSLAANSKNGTMISALKRLQPLLPPDIQRTALPYQTVVRATKAGESEAKRYQRFTGDEDADSETEAMDKDEERRGAQMRETILRADGLARGLEKSRTKYSK